MSEPRPRSVLALLEQGARLAEAAGRGGTAIEAPGRPGLSWSGLLAQVRVTAEALARAGIGRSVPVASVLPNGPEAAVAFLGTAARAVAAPLNPTYRRAEVEYYLDDLRPGAVLVGLGSGEVAAEVARARGLPVFTLTVPPGAPAGTFSLDAPAHTAEDGPLFSGPGDPALVLHTSGTTARPKRVPLTQAALAASAQNIARTLALGPTDRGLELMPLFHIHGLIGALLAPLSAGGSVACLGKFDAAELVRALDEFQPTWYSAVPSMHRAILTLAEERRAEFARAPLRFVRSSSASLPAALMADLEARLGVPVIESYGMTEASHQMASNPLPPAARKPGSVGPAAGPEVRVMKGDGSFAQVREEGEVVIRGENVTHGYEGDPEVNASAFREGWFRTGDQGYLDEDGYLFLTGRLKELINRGGEKISPKEVDEALYQHPAVLEAITFARPHPTLGEDVAAAVVFKDGLQVGIAELKAFLALRLAEHKVPRTLHVVAEIPRGATGKLVRIGLADKLGIAQTAPASPPSTEDPLERRIAALLGEILGGEASGPDDDFFALGGDSALATAALARLHGFTGVELSIGTLLGAPTPAGLARAVRLAEGTARAPVPIPRDAGPDDDVPVSLGQGRFWLIDRLDPESRAYARPLALRLVGPLDPALLGTALTAVFARHEVLRASFASSGGRPRQRIAPPGPVTLHGRSPESEDAVASVLGALASRRVDLAAGAAGAPELSVLGENDHLLTLPLHHAAFDAGSVPLLVDDLLAAYVAARAGTEPAWAPLAVRYRDFAAWQKAHSTGERAGALAEHWRTTLAGAPAELALPFDRPRPAERRDLGARLGTQLSAEASQALRALARSEGATLFITLFAAFSAFLARLTGGDDLVVGTPVSQRNRVELEALVGLFVNTLVLRVSTDGDPSFRELLARARAVCASAYDHQDLPFERLVELLDPPRDAARTPLFNVFFQLRPPELERSGPDGLAVRELPIERGVALVDLSVELIDRPAGFECRIDYDRELFDEGTIAALGTWLGTIFDGLAREPDRRLSELPFLAPAEVARVLALGIGDRVPYPRDQSVHALFAAQAARSPERIALVFADSTWSYGRLAGEAARIRGLLRAAGVAPGSRVGLWSGRGPETIAAMLGVLESGCAYVPLDPGYPEDRVRVMATYVDAVCVDPRLAPCPIDAHKARVSLLGEFSGAEVPPVAVEASAGANVIFTSGSTGEPRGVALTHRGIVQLLFGGGLPGLGPEETMLQVATLAFDASTWEIWGALLHGARLVIHADGPPSPSTVAALVQRHAVRTMLLTPSLFSAVVDDGPARLKGVRHLFVGGEAPSREHVRKALSLLPETSILNLYGPTEATVCTTTYAIPRTLGPGDPIPIGRPLGNMRAHVLDRHLNVLPPGVIGELHLGGDGLAIEYLGRPELTAEKFVPSPFSRDDRLYRTGDLVRSQADGNLEFVGRRDHQIKLRGFRVELGEVEQVARGLPGVRAAAAVVRALRPGDLRLELFVEPETGTRLAEAEVLGALRAKLPPFMVPADCTVLERFPHLPNGKLDRAALAALAPSPERARRFEAPMDPSEVIIAEIWERLLDVRPIGRADDFFELGGHSLLAARMVDEVERALGVRLPLREMFTEATVASLAQRLVAQDTNPSILRPVQPEGTRAPFFFLHGDFNGGGFYSRRLARALGAEQPFYVLHPVGLDGGEVPATIEELASRYVSELLAFRPRGPYRLGGYCAHGLVAFEVARRLEARGEHVERLLVFGAEARNAWLGPVYGMAERLGALPALASRARKPLLAAAWLRQERRAAVGRPLRQQLQALVRAVEQGRQKSVGGEGVKSVRGEAPNSAASDRPYRLLGQYRRAMAAFVARPYRGTVHVLWPSEDPRSADPTLGWGAVAPEVQVHVVPGSHLTSVTREWEALAEAFRAILA